MPPTSGLAPPFGGPSVPSSPAFGPVSSSSKSGGLFQFKSGINVLWVLLVGVLAGFIIDVRMKCDSKDPDSYNNGTRTIFTIGVIVLMICVLILLYEFNEYIYRGRSTRLCITML